MIPEIALLTERFSGCYWYKTAGSPIVQEDFARALVENENFHQTNQLKNPGFSARDRIDRGPKSLGFVDLFPTVKLTEPGRLFIYGSQREQREILLRQLLKFQLPSPYHRPASTNSTSFWVKPYLEIIRLIDRFGSLTFDELKLFGLQLTDYHDFDSIAGQIEVFRAERTASPIPYKRFLDAYHKDIVRNLYADKLETGDISVRQSTEKSSDKFIKNQMSKARDYTDALIRYLRMTGLFSLSQSGHSISVAKQRQADVSFILENTPRDPVYVEKSDRYKIYLFDATQPALYTDDRESLCQLLDDLGYGGDTTDLSTTQLKDTVDRLQDQQRDSLVQAQVERIQRYEEFDDIMGCYEKIEGKEFLDQPLMFEYNTWRALTMLDGGAVEAGFTFDDAGEPLSTAPGNAADILCTYDYFSITVEVTLRSGAHQHDYEGESVARHLGNVINTTGKDAFCLFIAPKVNEACAAYFYSLTHFRMKSYGGDFHNGCALIIPLNLASFEKMLACSRNTPSQPTQNDLYRFGQQARRLADEAQATDAPEETWFEAVNKLAETWLV